MKVAAATQLKLATTNAPVATGKAKEKYQMAALPTASAPQAPMTMSFALDAPSIASRFSILNLFMIQFLN
jgi:hypothetical protein